jgi:phosphate-selective porin OprO/OprP
MRPRERRDSGGHDLFRARLDQIIDSNHELAKSLTGESRAYDSAFGAYGGIVPNNPVNIYGTGWGAWEIAARYSVMNLNDVLGTAVGIAGGQQTIYTAGLNWYMNRNIRFILNYLHGTIEKQAQSPASIPSNSHFENLSWRL